MKKEKLISKLQREIIEKSRKNLSKKESEKLESKKRKLNIAAAKSAMYNLQKENIDAPFGKTFKTGKFASKKDYKRSREKYKK